MAGVCVVGEIRAERECTAKGRARQVWQIDPMAEMLAVLDRRKKKRGVGLGGGVGSLRRAPLFILPLLRIPIWRACWWHEWGLRSRPSAFGCPTSALSKSVERDKDKMGLQLRAAGWTSPMAPREQQGRCIPSMQHTFNVDNFSIMSP